MSNDLKYVLLPSIDEHRRPPKFQPWSIPGKNSLLKYRERIKMKYPCNINTQNWKFVKDGLDDFRDGLPPPHDDIILQPDKGPGPVLISETRRIKSSAAKTRNRLKDHQVYFSKEIPAVERRREAIDNYISTILTHPMAFFEHFNQTLPPEMYERLTRLLEAELLRSDSEEPISFAEEYKNITSVSPSIPITRPDTGHTGNSLPPMISPEVEKTFVQELTDDLTTETKDETLEESDSRNASNRIGRPGIVYDDAGNQWDIEEFERKQKNPYRWFIQKQREKEAAKGPTADERAAAAMEERLHNVSEKFCNWLYDLGGEKNDDIDSGVVRNLFSTAYDTKPSLSVPIKIVDMARVPAELREGTQDTMFPLSERAKSNLSEMRKTPSSAKSKPPSVVVKQPESYPTKYRYGAWYLPKNLWQRSLTNNELRDPKIVKAERENVTRQQEEEINARLAPLHGVDAFKEYLQENNFRRLPKLITDVEQYRRQHTREVASAPIEAQAKRTINSAP
ncbi:unnamed protein product [Rotaria socialis]|uniref:Uncharacterized protein n=1 Tax=Rotaria socialis TaxID=392032 RepID=A0A821EG05_9BILA|nr:unnamed protein product [Rotaria socialis]CAF4408311.1 unnamed protein product [Rotaria socialis]CAF4423065.1 unnamed protein product [Rotaria socialis]CAF4636700.1 unnamed protein product [Rotaria socialis]CAF4644743.1 unnamed protein product [Rotaria socialis]